VGAYHWSFQKTTLGAFATIATVMVFAAAVGAFIAESIGSNITYTTSLVSVTDKPRYTTYTATISLSPSPLHCSIEQCDVDVTTESMSLNGDRTCSSDINSNICTVKWVCKACSITSSSSLITFALKDANSFVSW
jgi:hypothetical protein